MQVLYHAEDYHATGRTRKIILVLQQLMDNNKKASSFCALSAVSPDGQITVLTEKTGIHPSLSMTGNIWANIMSQIPGDSSEAG